MKAQMTLVSKNKFCDFLLSENDVIQFESLVNAVHKLRKMRFSRSLSIIKIQIVQFVLQVEDRLLARSCKYPFELPKFSSQQSITLHYLTELG